MLDRAPVMDQLLLPFTGRLSSQLKIIILGMGSPYRSRENFYTCIMCCFFRASVQLSILIYSLTFWLEAYFVFNGNRDCRKNAGAGLLCSSLKTRNEQSAYLNKFILSIQLPYLHVYGKVHDAENI